MTSNIFGERRAALEETFFSKENERLRRRLAESAETRDLRQALSAASGITDEAALNQLMTLGITPRTLAAISLVPLVLVAWADGEITASEREAVLRAADACGVKSTAPGYELLQQWLHDKPPADLLDKWHGYVSAVTAGMDGPGKRVLHAELIGRARAVAEASGGFLGLTERISAAEHALLAELDRAFA